MEGVRQPRLGENTKNSRGFWGGTKTMGITSGILVKTGISHSSESLTWTSVTSDQRDNTGGTVLTYTLQCVSRQRGKSLDVTHSGGRICHPLRTRDGGRKVHGHILCVFWHDWIKVSRMDPRGRQCSHWNLRKGRPDEQCCKIQDHDFSAGIYLCRYVRGGFQSEEQRRVGHIPGASTVVHPMPILWVGVNGQFHDEQ